MSIASASRRLLRAVWWLGVPIVMLGSMLVPRPSVIYVTFEPFSIESNTLPTDFHPILGELLAGYRVTAVALALLIMVTTLSHVRRTHAVRILSLLLPTYVAGIEACNHFYWFGSRHHFAPPPTVGELRHNLHLAAIASVLAVIAPLLVAAALLRWCRAGIAGRVSWRICCAAVPVLSVAIIWAATDRIFFGSMPGPP